MTELSAALFSGVLKGSKRRTESWAYMYDENRDSSTNQVHSSDIV